MPWLSDRSGTLQALVGTVTSTANGMPSHDGTCPDQRVYGVPSAVVPDDGESPMAVRPVAPHVVEAAVAVAGTDRSAAPKTKQVRAVAIRRVTTDSLARKRP